MFGKLGDMAGMLRQVKDMQAKMEQAKAELAAQEHVGEGGGGAVKVFITGEMLVSKVVVSDECVKMGDATVLGELFAEAVNAAIARSKAAAAAKLSEAAGGINLPGLTT